MAKGNLFLGTAARSVGDVVMYRREGSQVSRVRVRKIANPKTEAQCRQRAYMAPIPKFFSPLAVVLERSFEGLSKAKSYAKFIKVNADKARANDWLLPKGIGFFPLPYQLSQGTLPQIPQSMESGNSILKLDITATGETHTTIGQLSTDLIAVGYQNGDVVTIICVNGTLNGNNFVPVTMQFIIDNTSEVALTTLDKGGFGLTYDLEDGWFIGHDKDQLIAGAIIVARFENDKWRRSTQDLLVDGSLLTQISAAAYKAAAIESYSASAAGANPMVYLDGDELDNA